MPARIGLVFVFLVTTAAWCFAIAHTPKRVLWWIGATIVLIVCIRIIRGVSEREYFKGVGFKPPT